MKSLQTLFMIVTLFGAPCLCVPGEDGSIKTMTSDVVKSQSRTVRVGSLAKPADGMESLDEGSQDGRLKAYRLEDNGLRTVITRARFDQNYSQSVDVHSLFIYIYNYTQTNQTTAVRVSISASNYTLPGGDPQRVMFSARQSNGILAWTLPFHMGDSFSYSSVSRTLCPVSRSPDPSDGQEHIVLEVSSLSQTAVPFRLNARLLPHFLLSHEQTRPVHVVIAQPKYFLYTFPDGVDQVLLRVTSRSTFCMTVSVQNVKCPVSDLEDNIQSQGKHQTMSTQAYLYLQRADFEDSGSFYLVLSLQSNDEKCEGVLRWFDVIRPSSKVTSRFKDVEILIRATISSKQYWVATMTVLAVLVLFYIVSFGLGFLYSTRCTDWRKLAVEEEGFLLPNEPSPSPSLAQQESEQGERSYFNAHPARQSYQTVSGATPHQVAEGRRSPRELGAVTPSEAPGTSRDDSSSLDEEDIDFLSDADQEKDVVRSKISLFVSDLSRKKRSKLDKHYNLYIWNLIALAIFYALPAIQLVITYQQVLFQSGNEDLCYYNFACAHPLKSCLSSFNNVYSNIGYVMLGLLFILIVKKRQRLFYQALGKHRELAERKGLPQHFGGYYAMGFALVMEGVMSGGYHVCPSYNNFQFDTSFMYIIACLCMLRIYQSRHSDICAKAHTAYFSMAFVILIALLGVVYRSNVVWILYALIHMFFTLVLSAQVYFLGRWRVGWTFFKRFVLFLYNDCRRCSRPTSPNRFIMLLIGNVINWAFALYGAIAQPSDFASYLLAVFIGNLLLYCVYYLLMKCLSKERIGILVLFVMGIALVCWVAALYFFFQHLTSWQLTPSGSREGNQECILLSFYDAHDVWHFLSAFGLFFSFMILLILDDDLHLRPRDQIPVF